MRLQAPPPPPPSTRPVARLFARLPSGWTACIAPGGPMGGLWRLWMSCLWRPVPSRTGVVAQPCAPAPPAAGCLAPVRGLWLCGLIVLIGLMALAAPAGAAAAAPGGAGVSVAGTPLPFAFDARVTRVTDGDTLWVQPLAGGDDRKLRLDGLDAPEICQSGGPAARAALAARVLGRVVAVQVRAWDSYGRALAQVQVQGDDVAAALVRQGHAWSSRWRGQPGPYAAEEAQARTLKLGIFAQPGAETPRDFRHRHGACPWP